MPRALSFLFLACGLAFGCGDDAGDGDPPDAGGGAVTQVVFEELPGALLSVWGSSADDVWAVGSDPEGDRPTVFHLTGGAWQMVDVGSTGDLWWVFGIGGVVYVGGAGGRILMSEDGESFDLMPTPLDTPIVFGIWGCSTDDVWAVGGNQGGAMGAFAWHLVDGNWTDVELPGELAASDAVWKVAGNGCDDVWMIGTNGLAIHWDGDGFSEPLRLGEESLFTAAATGELTIAVGGGFSGAIYEHDGADWTQNVAEADAPALIGVCTGGPDWYAVGRFASVLERGTGSVWTELDTGGAFLDVDFHGCWVDEDGGIWAVGGLVLTDLTRGAMIHIGEEVPSGT